MSIFGRSRIRRDRDGFAIRLPEAERSLLVHLPDQLFASLAGMTPDNAVPDGLERLFPRAHTIDQEAETQYVSRARDALIADRRETLACIASTAQAEHISDDEADAWLSAINSLRLALGSRLDVTEDGIEVLESNPAYADWICYQYLSYLESELIEEMDGALPPPRPGAGDDLPEDPWGEPLGGLRWDGTPEPQAPQE